MFSNVCVADSSVSELWMEGSVQEGGRGGEEECDGGDGGDGGDGAEESEKEGQE